MWIRDVTIESTPLDTTGGHTWKAAYRLADFLEAMATQLGLDAPGANILELGSGTGWLGLTLARNAPSASLVCLTEQHAGLAWLRHNADLNRAAGLPLDHVRVQACDWTQYASHHASTRPAEGTSPSQPTASQREATASSWQQYTPAVQGNPPHQDSSLTATGGGRYPQELPDGLAAAGDVSRGGDCDLAAVQWDFVVGSDLIYNEVGSRCLPCVLRALCTPSTQVLYCHTKHRYDLLDWEFMQQLEELGLEWREVWEPGAMTPPSSPPPRFPPEDLFPQQRIAVYRITRRQ